MMSGSNDCDRLTVGNENGSGRVNFFYNGGTATVGITPEGRTTTGHKWPVLYYGKNNVTNTNRVTITPATGYTLNWDNPNYLEIDN